VRSLAAVNDKKSCNRFAEKIAPLYFGIVDASERDRVLAGLIAKIERRDNHLDTGVVGSKFLLNALVTYGRADVAYKIANQRTFPGWGFWIERGANTLWQKWDDSMSRNHIMFGDISAWMFKHVAGLQPDPASPGFQHFFVRPCYFDQIDWATAEHESPYGTIRCQWRRDGKGLELDETVPFNSTATVSLRGAASRITENEQPLAKTAGVLHVASSPASTMVRIGAGQYRFRVP